MEILANIFFFKWYNDCKGKEKIVIILGDIKKLGSINYENKDVAR